MPSRGLAVVLADNIYENLELHYPRLRLIEAGYEVKVAGHKKETTFESKEGYPVKADCEFIEIDPKSVKVLIIPGGFAPDKLRRYESCKVLVSEAAKNGAIIGMICHAGWVAISAKILQGKKCTSVGAIRDDIENAGATWVDEPCVVDGRLVSAQVPKDLPAMMKAILQIAG
jgi:protease I